MSSEMKHDKSQVATSNFRMCVFTALKCILVFTHWGVQGWVGEFLKDHLRYNFLLLLLNFSQFWEKKIQNLDDFGQKIYGFPSHFMVDFGYPHDFQKSVKIET